MAAEKLQDETVSATCHIYTDSQAAINAINNSGRQSGQPIIKDFLEHIDDITNAKPQQQITMTWILDHSKINGNERADIEAKKAALDPKTSRLFKYKPLKSARLQYIKKSIKKQ